MKKPCPNCHNDKAKYGFILERGGIYMTMVKEIKTCCAVKVKLIDYNASEVKFEAEDNHKIYTKQRTDFMTSSWQLKGPQDTKFVDNDNETRRS